MAKWNKFLFSFDHLIYYICFYEMCACADVSFRMISFRGSVYMTFITQSDTWSTEVATNFFGTRHPVYSSESASTIRNNPINLNLLPRPTKRYHMWIVFSLDVNCLTEIWNLKQNYSSKYLLVVFKKILWYACSPYFFYLKPVSNREKINCSEKP